MLEEHMGEQLERRHALQAAGISKSFFGARALEAVDFSVSRGEVHGLVGKNGAGKSTLIKILSGAQSPDSGRIDVGETAFGALDPQTCRKVGIAVVHQNAQLHPDLSVAANVFLGAEPRGRFGFVDEAEMLRRTVALMNDMGLAVPAEMRLGDLDICQRQQVAIVKAVREDAKVLMLDEPTAALNKGQAEFLFALIRDLAAKGMAIIYISHHLDEVLAISDRITVLRDGRTVGIVEGRDARKDGLIAMMVGRSVEKAARRIGTSRSSQELLSVRDLALGDMSRRVSLTLNRGEIIGVTGLIGCGARELAETISGIRPARGSMTFGGVVYAPRSVREAIARGIVFIPEDMRERGLVMPMSVSGNIALAAMGRLSRFAWLDAQEEKQVVIQMSERLDLRPRAPDREVRFLSGGNQRKALLGRAVLAGAKLFVLDDPTQGVDVEAQRQIHEHLRTLAGEGAGILFHSTDLEELIELSDRIVVMRSGGIGQVLSPTDLTPELLLAAIQDQSNSGNEHV
jgi:ABC-type sugar transport system ATPase subunit